MNLAIIGAALFYLWQWWVEPALRVAVGQRQEQLLRRAVIQIVEFVDQRAKRLATVGEIGRFWRADQSAKELALTRLMQLDPQIREVLFADAAGGPVTRIAPERVFAAGIPADGVRRSASFRIPMRGTVYYGSVDYEFSADPFVSVAVPVRNTNDTVAGVIVAKVSLKTPWAAIADISAESGGIVSIYDLSGRVIAHPD